MKVIFTPIFQYSVFVSLFSYLQIVMIINNVNIIYGRYNNLTHIEPDELTKFYCICYIMRVKTIEDPRKIFCSFK